MNLGYMFAVPLADFRMDDPQPLCDELSRLFLEKESQGDQYRNEIARDTQHGLFESKFDVFHWTDAPVRQIAGFCHTGVATVVNELSDYSEEEFQSLVFDYHAWFHVTRKGGFQGLHHHQNASWSGIFCIDPGDTPEDFPNSGAVRFHDPRGSADQYRDAGNNRLKMPVQHGSYQIQHQTGKLIVFPSYLDHEVLPYHGDRPRIVVAFNCWIKESGQR